MKLRSDLELIQFYLILAFRLNLGHSLFQLPHLPQSKPCTSNPISVAKWTDTHDINDRMLFRNSYIKSVWTGFEPTTIQFSIHALTTWSIRYWVQLPLRANFLHLRQFYVLFSVQIFFPLLPLSNNLTQSKSRTGNDKNYNELMHMLLITKRFLEIAIESPPD